MRTTIIIAALTLALGYGKKKPQPNPNPPAKPEQKNEVKKLSPNSKLTRLNTKGSFWNLKEVRWFPPSPSDLMARFTSGPDFLGTKKLLYAIKTDSKGLAKSPWPMRSQNPQRTDRAPAK